MTPAFNQNDALRRIADKAATGSIAGVREILAAHPGLDLNAFSDTGSANDTETVLGTAAHYGVLEIVSLLVAHGADVNIRDNDDEKRTPLMAAVSEGHADVARWLIMNGADVNLEDNNGSTAADVAIWEGRVEMLPVMAEAAAAAITAIQRKTAATRQANLRQQKQTLKPQQKF